MQKRILVASVHQAFGELLRLSFEERGGYSVRLVDSCEKTKLELGRSKFDLLVVDVDEKDASLEVVLPAIAKDFPDLPLMVFPPQNNPHHTLLQGLPYQAWLSKPFYLPDLLTAAEAVLAGRAWSPPQIAGSPTDLTWLKEDLEPGSRISNLLREDCLAAIFISYGGPVIAQAGNFPAAVGEEVAALVNRSWREGQTSDLARYIRLDTTGTVVLLYVTILDKPLLAALIFSAETPLMRARTIAAQAVQGLHRPHPARHAEPVEQEENELKKEEDLSGIGEGMDDRLLDLLESAPSPDPFKIPLGDPGEWQPGDLFVPEDQPNFAFPWETGDPQADPPLDRMTQGANKSHLPVDLQPPLSSLGAVNQGEPQRTGSGQVFTCILIPRRAEHHLDGALAEELGRWIPRFCDSAGWNLLNLKITPEALQWTQETSINVVPGSFVRVMRQESSQHIYSGFPQVRSGAGDDFWAPGSLIVSGDKSPAPNLLQDFIQRTRSRQSAPPPE